MTTSYCSNCGTPHDCTAGAGMSEAEAQVEIARINRKADVEIARLGKAETEAIVEAEAEIAESELVAEAVAAEAHAEGMVEVLEVIAPPPVENPEPVIVEPPAPEPEPEDELAPPVTEHHETSQRGSSWHW